MAARRPLEKVNHQFYTPLPWGISGVCTYCGMPADTVDHVPPIAYVENTESDKYLVPACRECNTALGAEHLLTLEERAEFLQKYLNNRYKSVLATPHWEEYELEELGRSLRESVEMAARQKAIVLERLRKLQETAGNG